MIPSINAEARSKATSILGDRGFVPIGVQLPKIYSAQATIKTCKGTQVTSGSLEIPLKPVGADPNTPGVTIWAPDPAVYGPGGNVGVNQPTFVQNVCGGSDYEGLDRAVRTMGCTCSSASATTASRSSQPSLAYTWMARGC